MSRGLTDPIPEPEPEQDSSEVDRVIVELIKGQNKLHDRLVDMERQVDHLVQNWNLVKEESPLNKPKRWKKGL